MGRRYSLELEELADTYQWALAANIEGLTSSFAATAAFPLLAIGSGGSLTGAHVACFAHETHTGRIAKAVTPLQCISVPTHLGALGIVLISARGTNTDVLSVMKNVISREPRRCVAICFRTGSPLGRIAAKHPWVELFEFDPPWRKDGFLATNSLLAVSVLLLRAYAAAYARSVDLPVAYSSLIRGHARAADFVKDLRDEAGPVWNRHNLLVLYDSSAQAAAVDLESKFAEAGLGSVQLADYRNFAHGRHNWISAQGRSSSVVALFGEAETGLAQKTISLLPKGIPVAEMPLPATGATTTLAGIVAVLHIVGAVSSLRGVDPGRPHVAPFGRRLYRLRGSTAHKSDETIKRVALARKMGCDWTIVETRPDLEFWHRAYDNFLTSLGSSVFGSVVCDYDGTICDERDRFTGIRREMTVALTELLNTGVRIGIATGRGKSVRESLRNRLPAEVWKLVTVAYYNGAEVGALSDDNHPSASLESPDSFRVICREIQSNPVITRLARCEFRATQISIQPRSVSSLDAIWRLVEGVAGSKEAKVFRTSHSIDVVSKEVSKTRILGHLRQLSKPQLEVLVIGDKGNWPGNDRELLDVPYSLCVDEVSGNPDTCWNLAPPGYRGCQATLHYFRSFKWVDGAVRVNTSYLATGKET